MDTKDRRQSNRRVLQPGEWACSDAKCAHVNSERRRHCESCGSGTFMLALFSIFNTYFADKPQRKGPIAEIGKEGAEKSKGLFSEADWVCTK